MAVAKTMGSKRDKKYQTQIDNPIEIIKDFGTGIVKSVVKDVAEGIANTAANQIGLNNNSNKIEGTLTPGESFSLPQIKKEEGNTTSSEWVTANNGFVSIEKPTFNSEKADTQRKIEEILRELKILSKTIEKVSSETAKIGLTEVPQNAGTYHLNFFEWILRMVKNAREKVEESGCWLKMFQSRKNQKNYWAMFKKHGTSFGLSDERSVASQVG